MFYTKNSNVISFSLSLFAKALRARWVVAISGWFQDCYSISRIEQADFEKAQKQLCWACLFPELWVPFHGETQLHWLYSLPRRFSSISTYRTDHTGLILLRLTAQVGKTLSFLFILKLLNIWWKKCGFFAARSKDRQSVGGGTASGILLNTVCLGLEVMNSTWIDRASSRSLISVGIASGDSSLHTTEEEDGFWLVAVDELNIAFTESMS